MADPDTDGDTAIPLPARCGSSVAHEIVAASRAMEPAGRIVVTADAVARMSCATVLALVSLARTAAQTGGTVVVKSPTAAFTDAFSDLGLFDSLMSMEFAE